MKGLGEGARCIALSTNPKTNEKADLDATSKSAFLVQLTASNSIIAQYLQQF